MMRKVLFGTAALLVGLSLLVVPAQADPDYDPACDIDRNGVINVVDIMRVAALWRETGTWSCFCIALPVPTLQTGQSSSFRPGDDGDLKRGAPWPNPRFTDNGDGTVTDNLTALIWLKDAYCTTLIREYEQGHSYCTWGDGLDAINELADGYCGLSDGSVAGDWRLPNINELQSLVHYGVGEPSLPNTAGTGQWAEGDPFTEVQWPECYWSSTTLAGYVAYAWSVQFDYGYIHHPLKGARYCKVWPVRGGL